MPPPLSQRLSHNGTRERCAARSYTAGIMYVLCALYREAGCLSFALLLVQLWRATYPLVFCLAAAPTVRKIYLCGGTEPRRSPENEVACGAVALRWLSAFPLEASARCDEVKRALTGDRLIRFMRSENNRTRNGHPPAAALTWLVRVNVSLGRCSGAGLIKKNRLICAARPQERHQA